MAVTADLGRRVSRHLQNADIVRIVKELDEDEQREAEAQSDAERVNALAKEFEEINHVDTYLKIKLARISAFSKHEEGIIKAQAGKIDDAKKKLRSNMKKLPKDPSAVAMKAVYESNLAQLEGHAAHLNEMLRKVQDFRKAIRESCVATIRSAAKIRFWA